MLSSGTASSYRAMSSLGLRSGLRERTWRMVSASMYALSPPSRQQDPRHAAHAEATVAEGAARSSGGSDSASMPASGSRWRSPPGQHSRAVFGVAPMTRIAAKRSSGQDHHGHIGLAWLPFRDQRLQMRAGDRLPPGFLLGLLLRDPALRVFRAARKVVTGAPTHLLMDVDRPGAGTTPGPQRQLVLAMEC